MKKAVSYLAIVFSLALASALAQAEPEACHEPVQGAMEEMMFKNMDTNGDGTVSKAEFNAFHVRRFKELDADKNGKITLDEMKGGHKKSIGDLKGNGGGMKNNGTTHLDERFNAADANHDGGLNRQEAQGMPMLSMYFDEVDADKDGKVTRQEYLDAMPLLHRAKQEKANSL